MREGKKQNWREKGRSKMTSSGQIVGYRRVSSSSQSLPTELPEVTGRIFEEKLTGAKRDRPALKCLDTLEMVTRYTYIR